MTPLAKVGRYITWGEATTTDHREFLAEQANPPASVRLNLVRAAADIYDPSREAVGRLHTNSGYRCPGLNTAIKGAKTSKHMLGLAFDVVPLDTPLHEAYEKLAASTIPFDQLIWEFGRWIHIGAAEKGKKPRGQRLAYYTLGERSVVWKPTDPRFRAV
jgi:hypothetical protein